MTELNRELLEEYRTLSRKLTRSDFQGLLMAEVIKDKITSKQEEYILRYVDDTSSVRICDVCGKLMTEGYCVDGGEHYFCSDVCLHTKFTAKEWAEKYSDDGDSYWTEWDD